MAVLTAVSMLATWAVASEISGCNDIDAQAKLGTWVDRDDLKLCRHLLRRAYEVGASCRRYQK
jgi:hypothetical protein